MFPDEVALDGAECVPGGYVEFTASLVRIIATIRRKIYYEPAQRAEVVSTSTAIQLMLDLESWHRSLPAALRLGRQEISVKHRRAIYLLHVQYTNAQAFLTRPFKLRKVTVQIAKALGRHVRSQDLDEEEERLSEAASEACCKGLVLLHEMITNGVFDGLTWLDGYYLYHQAFLLAFDFLGREVRDTKEDEQRKRAIRNVMGSLHNIRLCASFSVLTQVAFQLAQIVNIFSDLPPIESISTPTLGYAPRAASASIPATLEHILIKPTPTLPQLIQHGYPTPPFSVPTVAISNTSSPLTSNPTPTTHSIELPPPPQHFATGLTPHDMTTTPFFDKYNPLSPSALVEFNYFGDTSSAPFVGLFGTGQVQPGLSAQLLSQMPPNLHIPSTAGNSTSDTTPPLNVTMTSTPLSANVPNLSADMNMAAGALSGTNTLQFPDQIGSTIAAFASTPAVWAPDLGQVPFTIRRESR